MKYLFFFLIGFILVGCDTPSKTENVDKDVFSEYYFQLTGQAQGTTYTIIYQDSLERDLSHFVDSLLKDYDSYLSVYIDTSLISIFNNNSGSPSCSASQWNYDFNQLNNRPNGHFNTCFIKAKEIYKKTKGAFNPSVYPLVKYWGFFDENKVDKQISQVEIDSLLQLINFEDSMFNLQTDTVTKSDVILGSIPVVCKQNGLAKLDFNAIAQGHSVDVIGSYFNDLGVHHYMIELGGEVLCQGVNHKEEVWKIGVDKPIEDSSPGSEGFQIIVEVNNRALATSGNYRKYYEKDGIKYAHTIDPKTGYPVQHTLLSATVLADECALADGYATAFMVMGVGESKEFIQQHPELNLDVYFVFSDAKGNWETWSTPYFAKALAE